MAMQLTLREMKRYRVPFMMWLAISVVATVAGPFGTLEAMSLAGRAAYWSIVVGGSIILNFGAIALARNRPPLQAVAVWVGFVLLLSALAHVANSLLFSGWGGWADWLYLTGTVGLVTVAVHVLIWAVIPKAEAEAEAPDATQTFLRRLPIELRAPLVRIEAQDHYLNVVTGKGSTLILMRLGDAMAELDGIGLQVHRSHWIATQAVTRHRREGGRDLLVMSDDTEVPISRSFRGAAQDAGLF